MKLIRKILAGIIGFPLLILGIILIPIPGPGLLVCFIALFILSLGFDWANKYLDRAKSALRKIYDEAKKRADKIEKNDK
jgi:uncharacterized protein (TIGR02611 family)